MNKRVLATISMASAVLLGTAACSSSSPSPSGSNSSSSSAGEPAVITFWTNNSNEVYDNIISDFEKENPNITVEKTVSQTNQFLQNMQVAATNKSLPDVFFEGLGATLAHKFIDNGLVMNLDDHAKAQGWDSQFGKLAIDTLKYKDSWWEAPHSALGMGLFYSKPVFNQLGLSEPTSFDELLTDVETIKAAGITPISIGGKGSWMTMRFTDALIENFAGPSVHDSLYGANADWTQPNVLKALTTLQDWTKKGYFTPGFLSIDPSTDYVSLFAGKAAMIFEGPWEDSTIAAQGQNVADYGFFPFPTDAAPDNPRISAFAQGFMVAQNTKAPDAALKFLDYLTSDAVMAKYASTIDGPVANVSVQPPASQPNARTIKGLLESSQGYLPSDQRFNSTVLNTFFASQDSIVAGTKTPEEAAQAIQQALQNGG